jgi:hypothetical protein
VLHIGAWLHFHFQARGESFYSVGCIRSDFSLLVGTEAETLSDFDCIVWLHDAVLSKYKTTLHIRQPHLPLIFGVQEIARTEHA